MFKADWVQFFLPGRIHLEYDSISKLGGWLATLQYKRALILKIDTPGIRFSDEIEVIQNSLAKHLDGSVVYDDLTHAADTDAIDSATYFARQANVDVVCIIGSIDAINLGKIVALLATNRIFAAEMLQGKTNIIYDALPIIIIPIEPTMGEELAASFLIADKVQTEIVHISHDSLVPKLCVYDPKLAIKLDKNRATWITASLLACCIESSISSTLGPFTETLLTQALTYIHETALNFCNEPYKAEFATNMLWASAFIGVSTNTSLLGVNWALSKVLNKFFDINFYHAQGVLLPYVMDYHLTTNPQMFINIAKVLGEDISELSKIEAAIKAVDAVKTFFYKINFPSTLSEINFDKRVIPLVASLALKLPHVKHITSKIVTKEALETFLLAAS